MLWGGEARREFILYSYISGLTVFTVGNFKDPIKANKAKQNPNNNISWEKMPQGHFRRLVGWKEPPRAGESRDFPKAQFSHLYNGLHGVWSHGVSG